MAISDPVRVVETVASGSSSTGGLTDAELRATAVPISAATGAIVDLPVKGQAAMAASVPVAIANNQSAVPVSVASAGIASGALAAGALVDGADVTQGALADAGVITDAAGSVSAKLRGLIALWLGGLKASSAIIGKVGIDQTTPGTTNLVRAGVVSGGIESGAVASGAFAAGSIAAGAAVAGAMVDGSDLTQGVTTGAAVITDATGTLQQYLRGLVKLATTAGSFLVRATVASGGIASGGIASGAIASGAVASGAIASGAIATGAIVDLPTKGQKTSSGSVPVVLSSDHGPVPTKGTGFNIPVTLTVTNGAYSVADVVGGLITFANACSAAGKSAIINSLTLAGVVAIPYELWLFPGELSAGTIADNAAFAISATDAANCKGVIPISAADYNTAQSAFNVATVRGVGLQFSCTATTLYGYLKAVAVTSPGTTTLTITLIGEMID
ncbi:MAG: hypothetical protein KKH61_19785 [Gammaproteobacteria bacterium]|nr:hypothetical protein [Gammaproteobacteria bacterium]